MSLKYKFTKWINKYRAESLLATSVKFSIREYCYDNEHPVELSTFSMVTSNKNVSELWILESIYIKNENQILNKDFSSSPLCSVIFFLSDHVCAIYMSN